MMIFATGTASSRRSLRIPESSRPAGANLRSNRSRFASSPGCVAEFRASRPGRFQHDVSHDARLFRSCHHFLHPLVHGRTNLAILIELGVGFQEVRVERRLRVCGLDDRDPDAPRAQLMVERLGITFDRVLGRGIERPVRHGQETQHGADVDDATTALLVACEARRRASSERSRRSSSRRSTGPVRSSSLPLRRERHQSRRCSRAGRFDLPIASTRLRPPRPIHRWSRRGAASRTIAGPLALRVCWCRRPCSRPSRAARPSLCRCLTRRP